MISEFDVHKHGPAAAAGLEQPFADPDGMLDRCRELAATIGITRIANVTGLDAIGLPVVMVCRPMSRVHVVVQGKGPTLELAEISGILEAAEGFHAERIDMPLRYATQRDLKTKVTVVPTHMLPRLNVGYFHQDHRTMWIEGHCLSGGGPVWVPYECVHLDFSIPHPTGAGCFVNSSTGLACGNTWYDAVNHALLEVIERDAEALWHAGERWSEPGARIDLDQVDDPACSELVAKITSVGLSVAAWDTTSDIGVPCCSAMIYQKYTDTAPLRIPNAGSGADLVPAVALYRALSEAAQSRLTMISGVREDNERQLYEPVCRDQYRSIVDRIEGAPVTKKSLCAKNLPSRGEATTAILLGRLAAAGYRRAIAVDLTRPEIGLPVVRLVVPGLEGPHDAPGALPGVRALRVQKEAAGDV